MCFFPGNPKPPAPPIPEPKWWLNNPPELKEPKLQLNEEATKAAKKRRRKLGTRQLQIPLAPKDSGAGLGIPTGGR